MRNRNHKFILIVYREHLHLLTSRDPKNGSQPFWCTAGAQVLYPKSAKIYNDERHSVQLLSKTTIRSEIVLYRKAAVNIWSGPFLSFFIGQAIEHSVTR